MISVSALAPLFTSILYLTVGLFIISQVQSTRKKLAYSLWIFTTLHWQLFMVVNYSLRSPEWAPFFISLVYTGIVFIPMAFYHLMIELLNAPEDFPWLRLSYGMGVVWAALCWTKNGLLNGYHHYWWGYYPRAGRLLWVYLVFLSVLVVRMLVLLFRRQSRERLDPIQLRIFRWAFIIYLGGAFDFLMNYGVDWYPFGFVFLLIFLGLISYAIVKHQLFDVRLIIRKTLVYSMATLSLTAVYGAILIFTAKLFEGWAGASGHYPAAIAAVVIAMLFHPVRVRIQGWMDRRFPRESLNQEVLREATGRFVHEIKRPLANISLPAQLVLADLEAVAKQPTEFERLFPRLQQRMRYIIDESLRAGLKIEAIRDISLQSAIDGKVVDVALLLQHVLAQEKPRIDKEQILVDTNIVIGGCLTMGNEPQLEIALANVVKNAIDALANTPSSQKRRLRLSLSPNDEWIVAVIENSGPAIPAENLQHLFDPWFTTKGASGMGIGLYLSHEIMRRHNAKIEVQSQPDSTIFRLAFRSVTPINA